MDKEQFKKEMLELAKGRGLDLAEDFAGELGELAIDIVGRVVALSENKYDDMIYAALEGKAREALAGLIDKIDGEDDA